MTSGAAAVTAGINPAAARLPTSFHEGNVCIQISLDTSYKRANTNRSESDQMAFGKRDVISSALHGASYGWKLDTDGEIESHITLYKCARPLYRFAPSPSHRHEATETHVN
jgi:hypothetical protein